MKLYNHIRGTTPFKLQFVCVQLMLANGKPMRALVLSVAEISSPTHIMAALILENGTAQQMPIRREVFHAAQSRGDMVALTEAEVNGTFALFGPDGRVLSLADTEGGRKVG